MTARVPTGIWLGRKAPVTPVPPAPGLPLDAASTLRAIVAKLRSRARGVALAPDAGSMALIRQADVLATIAFELDLRREELYAAYQTAAQLIPFSVGARLRADLCARLAALLAPVGAWRGERPAHQLWTTIAEKLEDRVRARRPIGTDGDIAYLEILAIVHRREALRLAV